MGLAKSKQNPPSTPKSPPWLTRRHFVEQPDSTGWDGLLVAPVVRAGGPLVAPAQTRQQSLINPCGRWQPREKTALPLPAIEHAVSLMLFPTPEPDKQVLVSSWL